MSVRLRTVLGFGAGFYLVGASLALAEQQDSLDTARKDLEELPSTVTAANASTKPLDTGKLDLVIPSTGPTAGSANAARTPTEPSSQGWLLDALTKDSSSRSIDRAGGEAANRGNESRHAKLDTAISAETAKAWTPFMQSWLLPQNRLLVPSATSTMERRGSFSPSSNSSDNTFNNNASNRATPAEWLTGDAKYHDPLAPRPNPYLDSQDAQVAGPTDFRLPRSRLPNSNSSFTFKPSDATEVDENAYPIVGDTKPNARSVEPIAPPTSPLVNQQKYFPQLDRF